MNTTETTGDPPLSEAAYSGVTPLKGEVCEQYIRCGKVGCHCQEGEPHGPYYYRIWRDQDRVHKVYVKQSEVADVRQACAAYKHYAALLRQRRNSREQITRRINRTWRTTCGLRLAAKPRKAV